MPNELEIPFDRITYRDGQRLAARDLNDEQRRHARLRALHNRHLHETWGIVQGYTVHTQPGNEVIIIGPGYAVDAAGRDLLMAGFIGVPLPDSSGPEMFVLTMSYRDDGGYRDRRAMEGLCPGVLDHKHERPDFSWQRPREVSLGLQVPLVAVTVAQGVISGGLNLRVRRNARRQVRPHIGEGATEAGRTGWGVWAASDTTLGLEVTVDTAEAGFNQETHYFAVLRGDFSNRPDDDDGPLFQFQGWPSGMQPTFSMDAFGFITGATPDHFTYRITCVGQPHFIRTLTPSEAESRGWHITWLGVEPAEGKEPAPNLSEVVLLSVFK